MKVLVVGAGIAGLTLAAFLKQQGISALVVEKEKNWDRFGYSLGFWNSMITILETLGLKEWLDSNGYLTPFVEFADQQGNVRKKYDFSSFSDSQPVYKQVDRERLHDMLRSKLDSQQILLNRSISKLNQLNEQVEVLFSDGKKELFDMVVGADGVHSEVRKMVFGNDCIKDAGWRGWYFWVDSQKFPISQGVYECFGSKGFFGYYPHGGSQTCAYVSIPWSQGQIDDPHTRLEKLREHFKDFPIVLPILHSISRPDALYGTNVFTVELHNWYKNRVILIGDAAHAIGPYAGLQATMAVEDGYVLAQELASINVPSDVTHAFERYVKRRKERVSWARNQTNLVWRITNIQNPFVVKTRNAFIKYIPSSYFISNYRKLLTKTV